MQYYTYAYLREDRTPYYIGKGQGNRAYVKRYGKGRAKRPKNLNNIILLKENLTEEEAFKHEIYMIAVFGRIDLGTGILHNRTDGGEGGSGVIMSDDRKSKISKKLKHRVFTLEHRKKLSDARKGKKLTKETKEKIKKNLKVPLLYWYEIISPTNEVFIVDNLTQFCLEHDLNASHMYSVCRKKLNHYKNWKVTKKLKD
jgi:hypothetical protein